MSPRTHRKTWLALVAWLLVAASCNRPEAAAPDVGGPRPAAAVVEAATPAKAPPPPPMRERLTVHHAQELDALSPATLAGVRVLDLALSATDQTGRLDTVDPATTCEGLDLLVVADMTPAVRELRVSGCQAQLHAGLGAFGDRLEALELADVELDAVLLGRIAQLGALQRLSLVRVRATEAAPQPLRAIPLRELELRELDDDSELAALIELWPTTLTSLTLDGGWAAHPAMLHVPHARGLKKLVLANTNVTNFSLNQIKALTELREVEWSGRAFNNRSPMYLRDLPVTRVRCACPSMGDAGLQNLRRVGTLRVLELLESEITDDGVEWLRELEDLRELTILGRDLGAPAMAAIGSLSKLRSLRLGGVPFTTVELEPLAELRQLEELELSVPNLDDRAAPALGHLASLRVLRVGHSQLSDQGLVHIGKLAGLRELELHHTRITRKLEPLAALKQLEILELDHTDLVDAAVANLITLPALRELRLDATLVTDGAIPALLQIRGLRRLNLDETVVSPGAAAPLSALPEIELVKLPTRN